MAHAKATHRERGRARRAFSLVEMLVALVITSLLMTATMTALDTSFKAYQVTTEGASTHVISRNVMSRMTSLVRQAQDVQVIATNATAFSLVDPFSALADPSQANIPEEFRKHVVVGTPRNLAGVPLPTFQGLAIRLENVGNDERWAILRLVEEGTTGVYTLQYIASVRDDRTFVATELTPLLTGVTRMHMSLNYDPMGRVRRVSIDMTVRPNDYQDASYDAQTTVPFIRLVGSAAPRRIEDESM